MGLFLLDYGAGNVQSLANTLERLGHPFKWISSPFDFDGATVSFAIRFLIPSDNMFIPAR
jgi:imidazoleglycerol phosphate synthase glutamine amidotransferase subunit HisH